MIKTLKQAIEVYGADMQLNIAIEEFAELTKEICKYKRGADNIPNIVEEVADCYIMLEQMKFIFNLDSTDISNIMTEKIERLKQRMPNVSKYQQNKDLPFNIGDTAYCVNGYEKKYIETFTVAEIIIRKEGIYLKDTNDMEWLAHVCHFSLKSAERELKAQKGLVDIVNENFDKEDIIIHLTYEFDKTPQSEEVRKDIVNYIRRLRERRSNNNV